MKKKIYILLGAVMAMSLALSACSDEQPFATISPDDEPHILDPTFPDRTNGQLATFANISRDANLTMDLTVTPAEYTTVTWYIDGEELPSGTDSDKELDIFLMAGTYNLRIVATTVAGKSTSREGLVLVNPLADDPQATTVGFERTVAPGERARLYGSNLANVKGLLIGSTPATDLSYVEDEGGNYIEYTIPDGLPDGTYRLVLQDTAGNEYGADPVTVTSNATVLSGGNRATSNASWTLTGINLDQVATLTIGGQTVSEFSEQTATSLTLTCPKLEDGDYQMTGTTKGGTSIQFLSGSTMATEIAVTISTERTLWQGHHYVSWDLPDGDPNKTFNLIPKDEFASMTPGTILKITYSIEPSAEYHQLQPATGWWTNLVDKIEFQEGGTYELELTQEMLDLIQEQDGFLCVGHGYYVDLVTVK
ncbi:MAG: hypothetical protein LBN24_13875 [Mediterranea sp.]|jgi:hypothetical protein|nr:hypothetical protein [Mediterranea sp.]